MKSVNVKLAYALLLFLLLAGGLKQSFAQSGSSESEYFTVENYYKVRWGFGEEFIHLWKTNHYPLLKKAMEKGDIIRVTTAQPKLHSSEDARWDFRVTIVFKNAEKAFDANLTRPYIHQLFPDEQAHEKAEQHRFELLLAHWDIEVDSETMQ